MKQTPDLVNRLRRQVAAGNPPAVAARAVADELPWWELLEIGRSAIADLASQVAPIVTTFGTTADRWPPRPQRVQPQRVQPAKEGNNARKGQEPTETVEADWD